MIDFPAHVNQLTSPVQNNNASFPTQGSDDLQLSASIIDCMSELCGTEVSLDSHNKLGGNYKYASLPHLQRVVMPLIKEHGLILLQSVIEYSVTQGPVKIQKKATEPAVDKIMTFAQCKVYTCLRDLSCGDAVGVTTYGTKIDQSSDKSLGAFTVAKRYGIAALFGLIVTDDDGADPDSNDSDVRNQLLGLSTTAAKPQQVSSNDTLNKLLNL